MEEVLDRQNFGRLLISASYIDQILDDPAIQAIQSIKELYTLEKIDIETGVLDPMTSKGLVLTLITVNDLIPDVENLLLSLGGDSDFNESYLIYHKRVIYHLRVQDDKLNDYFIYKDIIDRYKNLRKVAAEVMLEDGSHTTTHSIARTNLDEDEWVGMSLNVKCISPDLEILINHSQDAIISFYTYDL